MPFYAEKCYHLVNAHTASAWRSLHLPCAAYAASASCPLAVLSKVPEWVPESYLLHFSMWHTKSCMSQHHGTWNLLLSRGSARLTDSALCQLSGLSRNGSHHERCVLYGRRVLSLTGTSDRTWHTGSHCRLAGPPCAEHGSPSVSWHACPRSAILRQSTWSAKWFCPLLVILCRTMVCHIGWECIIYAALHMVKNDTILPQTAIRTTQLSKRLQYMQGISQFWRHFNGDWITNLCDRERSTRTIFTRTKYE